MGPVISLMGPPMVPPQPCSGATSTGVSSLAPDEVDKISDAVNLRGAGSHGEVLDPTDEAVDQISMEYMYAEGAHDTSSVLDTTQVFPIRDLVSSDIAVDDRVVIRSRDVIPYVLLKWDTRVDKGWSVPDPTLFHDLTNRVDTVISDGDLPCGAVLKWSNLWGKVGLLGLSAKNKTLLNEFRDLVEEQVTPTTKFTIYPRDGLDKKGVVTILLRETYRGFQDVRLIPKSLFRRTKQLRGGLRVTHVKRYGRHERSRAGTSKEGWRLVVLQGDAAFMESLEAFEADHRFPLGSDRVIIRGGSRRPSSAPAGTRPSSSNNNNTRAQGGQQRQQQQQQYQGRTGLNKSRNRSYDRDFPSGPGGSSEESRRGTRSGSANADSGVPVWGTSPKNRGHSL